VTTTNKRVFLLATLLVVMVGLSHEIQGQASDAIDQDLNLMKNGSEVQRIRGFYNLLQPDNRAKPFRASIAFKTLLQRVPGKVSDLETSFIKTLIIENDYVRRTNLANGTLTEEYSNYYGDLISVVSVVRDERSISALVGAIGTGNMATGALASIGAPAVDIVITSLRDPDKRNRQGAAITLGKMIGPESRMREDPPSMQKIKHALEIALRDPDANVRISTIDSLALLPDHDVILDLETISRRDPYKITRGAGQDIYPVREAAKKALAANQ
jgi:hypothetical protein